MVRITAAYEGGLRCAASHGPSGSTLRTDAPVDNQGRGELFSPTDLVATALGTCMMTVMGIAAERHSVDLVGMTVEVEKVMSTDSPRRIVGLRSVLTIPLPAEHPQRKLLEATARACPVHQSLAPEIEREITFRWTGPSASSR